MVFDPRKLIYDTIHNSLQKSIDNMSNIFLLSVVLSAELIENLVKNQQE